VELGAKGVIPSLELCANLSFCVEAAVFCIHSRMAYCARACTWCWLRYLAHIRRPCAFRPRSQPESLLFASSQRMVPLRCCNIAPMSYKQMPASFPLRCASERGRENEFAFLSFPLCAHRRTMGGARGLYSAAPFL
jgi:hypothetical protein